VVAALADSQAARNRDALLHSGRSAGEETLCLSKKIGHLQYIVNVLKSFGHPKHCSKIEGPPDPVRI
jgi:hypothetical protein